MQQNCITNAISAVSIKVHICPSSYNVCTSVLIQMCPYSQVSGCISVRFTSVLESTNATTCQGQWDHDLVFWEISDQTVLERIESRLIVEDCVLRVRIRASESLG